ncbi:HAD family hydrolase [Actinokineospora sp. UTMC 2448]|uniref:HAD family hydrolase n=1 Tax=Actinokineospora sp. UTMC 2448 TaxID=2268449 RepID=UPI002164B562|nr:HAD-IA family hydrolase [Actinokineospora sp. UTMC 2448]
MSRDVDDWAAVHACLAKADALLLDFDGPVCSVFSGFPAYTVADQLRDTLIQGGHRPLPIEVRQSPDPFEVLYYAATLGEEETRYVEAAFTAHECEAIQTAQPTPGAHHFIRTWHNSGRPLAIVSNNSRAAIETYISLHNLGAQVTAVAARDFIDLSHLKPSPYLLVEALARMKVEADNAVFLGDSATDIQAGRGAGVKCIAFANRPHKVDSLGRLTRITITRFPLAGPYWVESRYEVE